MSTPSPEAEPRRRRRGILFALLIGLAAFGLVGAAAATLGVSGGQNLGANDVVVASCDTNGVTLAYTNSYSAGTYNVTSVTVSGIDTACAGETMSVTLSGAGGTSLGSGTAVVPVGGGTQAVTIAPVAPAKSVLGASVVISG
jgi:hypothetical protein